MKKHSVLSALVMVMMMMMIGLNGMAQADLNDGLVAYYPFNGNANDASGRKNHGTINGATRTEDRFENANSAYNFDGVDDYINIGNNFFNFSEGTISAWINWAGGSENYEIVSLFTDSNNYFSTDIQNSGQLYHFLKTDGIVRWKYESEDILTIGSWYNLVFVHDGTSSKMYINGQLINQAIVQGSTSYLNFYLNDLLPGSSFTIGATDKGSKINKYFDGIIDDVRIYKRAITESEVQELFTEGTSCDSGYTETDLKTARQEGYEAGRQACIDNPASCGIEIKGNDSPSCSGTQNCAAMFDMFTNTLHIPNFQDVYWLDLGLNNWEPVTFELKNMGEIGTK